MISHLLPWGKAPLRMELCFIEHKNGVIEVASSSSPVQAVGIAATTGTHLGRTRFDGKRSTGRRASCAKWPDYNYAPKGDVPFKKRLN